MFIKKANNVVLVSYGCLYNYILDLHEKRGPNMILDIQKVHGSGNTFYLYETKNEKELDWANLAIWLCDKDIEDGADGLLVVSPSSNALAKMRVFNADGTEASMCGNGLRCVARYVLEKHNLPEGQIETMKAILHVAKEQPLAEGIPTYSVEISPVSFELTSLPMKYDNKTTLINEVNLALDEQLQFTAISVPNPHLISFVPKDLIATSSHQEKVASFLNGPNRICPDGVNVSYVYTMGPDEIYVRTFERGVGFTNACGTAMTASALVSRLLNYTSKEKITVMNPGGFVQCMVGIKQDDQYNLRLIGNATITALYTLKTEGAHYSFESKEETAEQLAYLKLSHEAKEKHKTLFGD